MIKKEKVKKVILILTLVVLFSIAAFFLTFAIGEVSSGDISGLSHLLPVIFIAPLLIYGFVLLSRLR